MPLPTRALAILFAALTSACGPSAIGPEPGGADGGLTPRADARPGSGRCADSCDGCCLGEVCFEGNHDQACGVAGETCEVCPAGASCAGGGCGTATDPCNGVPTTGRCKTETTIEMCVQPTGLGTPQLETVECRSGEACEMVGGQATCVQTAVCVDGETECASTTSLRRCVGGDWVTESCPNGCIDSALGDSCASGGGLVTISGSVTYETRSPNTGKTDWGPLWNAPAQGFLISSMRQTSTGWTYYDTQVTTAAAGDQGRFTLRVPASPTSSDYVVVSAAGTREGGGLSFVVADPRFTPRSTEYSTSQVPTSPAVWGWRWRASEVTNGGTLRITEVNGSGAARLFDYLRYVYGLGNVRWPGAARDPLVVWLGMGVEWTCGACQAGWPTTQFGTRFGAQIWIGGGLDEAYWADAVTAHELGHWVMGTFGRSVGEGGRHCFGVPSAPGLAWSEGWATWFSADARSNPVYVDKQGGTMFWLDISSRSTSGSAWPRPSASRGLLQDIYENEVSWMMWQLSSTQGLGNQPLDAALASERMTVGPFERDYTRHTWDVDMRCQRVDIEDTGQSTTHFADFLDALRCDGVARSAIDAVTEPATRYPYPAGSPACR
jgi:hypothetical protein